MKRFILIALTLLLALPCLISSAEASEMIPILNTVDGSVQPMESKDIYTYTQNCVVHVQVVDGETGEQIEVISPAVFTVEYKIEITKRSGTYSGGDLLLGDWPKVVKTGYDEYDLNVHVQRINHPFLTFQGGATSFSGTVRGGLLTVTYNSLIKVYDDNSVITQNPYTEQRAFYLEFSGPNSSH